MNQTCTLLLDIGNTNYKVGLAPQNAPLVSYSFPTDERQTADQFGLQLLALLRHGGILPKHVTACIGSSVVPRLSDIIRTACAKYLRVPLQLAPEDIPIPLENHYTRPHEVGADRLAGAFAARRLYPEAASIITVDFGTATTFDCVQGNAYLGGLICPGVLSSARALASNTAKLPQISLETTAKFPEPGKSTSTSLNHGFTFGFAAMTEGLCTQLKQTLQHPVAVVGTGGFCASIASVTSCFQAVHPDLLLEGLRILHTEHSTQST